MPRLNGNDEETAEIMRKRRAAAAAADAANTTKALLDEWDALEKPTGVGGNGPAGALSEMDRYAWNGHRIDGSVGRTPVAANDKGNPVGSIEEGQSYLRMLRLDYTGALPEVNASQIPAPFTGCDMAAVRYLVATGTILTPNERAVSEGSGGSFAGRVQSSDAWIDELRGGLTARKIADLWWNEKKLTVGTPNAGASGDSADSGMQLDAPSMGGRK